jgi:hypothetical protein
MSFIDTVTSALSATNQFNDLVKELHHSMHSLRDDPKNKKSAAVSGGNSSSDSSADDFKFSRLNPASQLALVEELHMKLQVSHSPAVISFENALASIIDTQVAVLLREREVETAAASSSSSSLGSEGIVTAAAAAASAELPPSSQADVVIEICMEGIVNLLQDLPPEHLALTRLMLGQPVPAKFRLKAFKLLLKNKSARNSYEGALAKSRISTISTMDSQITQQCTAGMSDFVYSLYLSLASFSQIEMSI